MFLSSRLSSSHLLLQITTDLFFIIIDLVSRVCTVSTLQCHTSVAQCNVFEMCPYLSQSFPSFFPFSQRSVLHCLLSCLVTENSCFVYFVQFCSSLKHDDVWCRYYSWMEVKSIPILIECFLKSCRKYSINERNSVI